MKNNKYSVLMSVYIKENPLFFRESLESIYCQTILPDEVIVIEDGPLTKDLSAIIDEYKKQYKSFTSYQLKENMGLGYALSFGLEKCRNEYIFRADTDDISNENRAEIQLEFMNNNKNVSIVGSYVDEFSNDKFKIQRKKEVPTQDEEIKKMMKLKNPLNHPTVFFRKQDIEDAGSYQELNLNEDYYLWVRMAKMGKKFANIPKSLVKMRVDDNTYLRRGGFKYFLNQNEVYKYMKKNKMISNFEYLKSFLLRFGFRVIITNRMRSFVYTRYLRK